MALFQNGYSVRTVAVLLTVASFAPFFHCASASPRAVTALHRTLLALPSLCGTISDANGSPLSGATVFVYTARPRVGISPFCPSCYIDCGRHQTTGTNGSFRISSLSRWLVFQLLVVRDGYAPVYVSNIDPLRGEPVYVTLARMVQKDPARIVVGQVVDEDSHPIVGATVEPSGVNSSAVKAFGEIDGLDTLAVTDEQGRFGFRCPQPDGTVSATIKARGMANKVVSSLIPGPGGAMNRIVLTEGCTVAGEVRDTHGRGIPDVTVEVVPTSTDAETFTGWQDIGTDKLGRFLVPNLPEGKQYSICAKMEGLTRLSLEAPRKIVATGADGTRSRDVLLTVRPAATIMGHLLLEDKRAVLPGVRILLSRTGTWDTQQTMLAANGDFTFRCVPTGEDMSVNISVPGYRIVGDTPGYDPERRQVQLKVPLGALAQSISIPLVSAENAAFTILVTGTPGAKFYGNYETQNEAHPVNETVPAHFTVSAQTVSAHFRKLVTGVPGTLKVQILKNGVVVAADETDARNGAVSASTR